MFREQIIQLYGGRNLSRTGANNIDFWLQIYRGESPWISGENPYSLNLGPLIADIFATSATIELESKIDNEDLDRDYQEVLVRIKEITEFGLALGGVILKPYKSGDRVAVDVVTPDMYVPLDTDSFGRITRIAFIDQIVKTDRKEDKYYTKIELHERRLNQYRIENKVYISKRPETLGTEIQLSAVEEWQDIAPEAFIKGIDYNLYGYFKNPQANNLDLKSPLGISRFSRAAGLLQDADEQYCKIKWEYEGTELAIDADITMFAGRGATELPKGKERLFRKLNASNDGLYEVFSPIIRDDSLFNGLNQILKKVEDITQLSRGELSDVEITTKTAEEIKATKQRMYAAICDIQKNLQSCLEDTVKAMAFWLGVKKYDISFEFDDSIVVDSKTEQAIRMQEVAAGLIKPEEYLMWRYGVSEEEAKKMLPEPEIKETGDDLE